MTKISDYSIQHIEGGQMGASFSRRLRPREGRDLVQDCVGA